MTLLSSTMNSFAHALKNQVRHYAFQEMKQIASGWGLDRSCSETDGNTQSTIQIPLKAQSRRMLLRFH